VRRDPLEHTLEAIGFGAAGILRIVGRLATVRLIKKSLTSPHQRFLSKRIDQTYNGDVMSQFKTLLWGLEKGV